MTFSEAKKREIVNCVLQDKKSITLISKKYNVSRKTIYQWLKSKSLASKYKKGKKHHACKYEKAYQYINRWVVSHPEWGCRRLSRQLKTYNLQLSYVQINKLLNKMGAENYDRRLNYARNFAGPARFKADVRREVVHKHLNEGITISALSLDYKLARKTIYSWVKRYQAELGLDDAYVSAEDHPRAIYPKITKKVLDNVIVNPSYSVHTLSKILPASSWTIWKILDRHNLNTVSARLAYAAQRPEPVKGFASQVFGRNKTPFEAVTPSNLPAPPPIRTFFQSFLLSFLVFLGFIKIFSVVTSVGLFFAGTALLMGSFFFFYSLKYYITLAIVLSYSQGEGDRGQVIGNRKNGFFDWILGNSKTSKNKTLGLEANLDNVILKEKPPISIHVALYNEKNVVERLCKALTSFDYPSYEVILADDSTDETSTLITNYQKKCLFKNEKLSVSRGDGFTLSEVEVKPGVILKHLHRHTRDGFKGAALKLALTLTNPKAQYISIFDADFVPYPDTLSQFLKYFQESERNSNYKEQITKQYQITNEQKSKENCDLNFGICDSATIAAVQGYQWHVLNKSENWITRGVRSEYSGSYVIERAGAEIYGGLKQISGSVYMIKRKVLESIGWGTSITEDFQLTLKLYNLGYKVAYTPYVQAPAECVSTLQRLIRQRMRWAEGHSQNIKKMFKPLMTNPKLTGMEKLEFLYLSPYYLQAFFFLVGTLSWLISETIFKVRLPFWTELWGWSLVLTNMISLPLVNAVGLFLEESEERDYSGLGSFVLLSYILVPFQAYASLKGFLESEEGGWFRTPKSGRVTDTFTRGRFMRFIQGIIPSKVVASSQSSMVSSPHLALSTANNRFNKFNIKKLKDRRWVGKTVLAVVLAITTTIMSLAPMIPMNKVPIANAAEVFNIDHETGDLTQYDSTVTDSGDLSVTETAALAGTDYGMSVLIDDNSGIYGKKNISPSGGVLRQRFYLDTNSLTMANGNGFYLHKTYTVSPPYTAISVYLQKSGSDYKLDMYAYEDDSTLKWGYSFIISDEPHYVEFELVRATNSTSDDGTAEIWVDGVSKMTLSNIDNYDTFADIVVGWWGAVGGIDTGTRGTFYMDEIVANNDGSEIGEVPENLWLFLPIVPFIPYLLNKRKKKKN